MPTYEYECTKCEHCFELRQSITAPPRKRCPKCRSKVIRVISGGGGIIFKGTGFHVTDYRSEAYKKSAEKDKPKTETKSEPKPDSKSKPKSDD